VDGSALLEELYTCASEPDYFAVTVPEAGTLAISVAFRGDALLAFRVYDNTGTLVSDLGSTATQSPASDTLAYLVPGQYFILVEDASTTTSLAKPYSLSLSFVAGGCERDSDCISVAGRSQCVFGTCQAFAPGVPGGPAANCDSNDDCAGDLTCFFGRDGLASNRCSRECADATDCADFTGGDCIDFFGGTMCVQGCSTDYECPINFTCDVPSATCSFVGCDVDADCGDGRLCRRTENQGIGFCTTIEAPTCRDDDAFEPNNSPGTVTALLTTAGLTGLQICDANDDWFVVEVTEEGKGLTLSATTSTTIDLDIFLFTEDGVAIGERRRAVTQRDHQRALPCHGPLPAPGEPVPRHERRADLLQPFALLHRQPLHNGRPRMPRPRPHSSCLRRRYRRVQQHRRQRRDGAGRALRLRQ
jgi:hypothetical protein